MASLKEPPSLLLLLMLIHVGLLFLSSCPSVLAQGNNGETEVTHIYCIETVFTLDIEHNQWPNSIAFHIKFASEIKFTRVQTQQRREICIVRLDLY